ncbi:hypothetical protein [Terriglobus albidus]|uniref:hypothetical protein n=1 Tax=Terriglobus albidus TaxID=1592106 RepID=UPI0021DF862B|nr:hypothetical protein [Terriglobus albidus]
MKSWFVKFSGCLALSISLCTAHAADQMVRVQTTPVEIIVGLIAKESAASKARPAYLYTSYERSNRTNGRLWKERVADLPKGRIRLLMEEDGRPLDACRQRAERERIKQVAGDPGALQKDFQAQQEDSQRAQRMLDLLPRAFLFERVGQEGRYTRIAYRPNPEYIPKSFEERVMHAMHGTVLVDEREFRLHQLEGRLEKDVSFGMGLLATLHSGSSFSTIREEVAPTIWKVAKMQTRFDGRAIFFKTINRQQQSEHVEFKALPEGTTITQAVDLLLQ